MIKLDTTFMTGGADLGVAPAGPSCTDRWA